MDAASRYAHGIVCPHESSRSWVHRYLLMLLTLLALLANVAAAISIKNPITNLESLPEMAVDGHQSTSKARSNSLPDSSKAVLVHRRTVAGSTRSTPVIQNRATPPIPSPTAQVTTGPGGAPIHCPSDNLTVFTEPLASKRYVILCGRDYHSSLGAKELYNVATNSLNECIDRCAKDNTGCSAVGWGYMEYYSSYRCFLKGSIGGFHASASWMVAVEDPSQPGNPIPPSQQGLNADAKAGIGVGVVAVVVLMGVGVVAAWYYRQRKAAAKQSLTQGKDLSGSSSSIGYGSQRTHSPVFQHSIRQVSTGEYPELASSPIKTSLAFSNLADADETPSRVVASYLVRQQRRMLESCRSARPGDDPRTRVANIETSSSKWGGTYIYSPDGILAPMSALTGHGSFTSTPWGASVSSPASELPVVHGGPNGYGPEYEMASDASVTTGRREGAAEKFLLSDVALLKEQLTLGQAGQQIRHRTYA